jgi:hypothetical protein
MCMFSGRVESVSSTNIFARCDSQGRQFLVYSMSYKATTEIAMVLPLPVASGNGEHALTFIALKAYPDFFDQFDLGFPADRQRTLSMTAFRAERYGAPLKVIAVGDFDASYVPTVSDFNRLDERFRLPEGTWDKLSAYRDFGFAVFKLQPGKTKVHPMALSFPKVNPDLFFPTVHIHDELVHEQAHFDHVLYCQPPSDREFFEPGWQKSATPLNDVVDSAEPTGPTVIRRARTPFQMDIARAKGTLVAGEHCYRRKMQGLLPNEDTIVAIRQ